MVICHYEIRAIKQTAVRTLAYVPGTKLGKLADSMLNNVDALPMKHVNQHRQACKHILCDVRLTRVCPFVSSMSPLCVCVCLCAHGCVLHVCGVDQ
jgi:hypothetical protein